MYEKEKSNVIIAGSGKVLKFVYCVVIMVFVSRAGVVVVVVVLAIVVKYIWL